MNKNVEYFISPRDFRDVTTVIRGDGPHLEHYERGYLRALQAAKRHLRLIFKNLTISPTVLKPDTVPWDVFLGERDHSRYFDWNFTEHSREFAERVGIKFGPKVIDRYPRGELVDEIDELTKDPDALSTFLNPHPEKFVPKEHYTADLTPIIPKARFINHDRALYEGGVLGSGAPALYLDLVGEGVLPVKSPWRKFSLTQEELARMPDILERPDSSDLEQFFKWMFGMQQYRGIPQAIDYYARHMRKLREGTLFFPEQPENGFTYLKDYDIDRQGEQATSGMKAMNVRFQIDVQELLRWRNIFTDPEGLTVEHEYGKTFLVPGGVPLLAVTGYEFWIDHGNNPPPLRNKGEK